jgi:hypothetical protein
MTSSTIPMSAVFTSARNSGCNVLSIDSSIDFPMLPKPDFAAVESDDRPRDRDRLAKRWSSLINGKSDHIHI